MLGCRIGSRMRFVSELLVQFGGISAHDVGGMKIGDVRGPQNEVTMRN